MQKQLLALVLPLLLVLLAAGDAQTPGGYAALQKVDVVRDADGINVELTARGRLTPRVSTLTSPDRVVVSLPDTVAVIPSNYLSVDGSQVKSVRIGTDGQKPPTTRVVIDCQPACGYELLPGDGSRVVLKLRASAELPPAQASESSAAQSGQTGASVSAAPAPPEYPQKTAAVGKTSIPAGRK